MGVVSGFGLLIYTIYKDRGIDARRARAVENAKNRLAFWDRKLSIQSAALKGVDLDKAKMTAVEAAENIHRDLDENLETLRVWSGPPPPIVGLPWWRKLFLLYKPIQEVKWLGYVFRLAYLLIWAGLSRYLAVIIWSFVLFKTETPAQQVLDRALLASRKVRGGMLMFGLGCLIWLWVGAKVYGIVRRERATGRFKELDRI